MTQGAFLEYLYVTDCYIYKQTEKYYKLRKTGTTGSKNMSGMPLMDSDKEMRPYTICQICHNLGVPVPEEVKFAEEVITYIRDKHLSENNENLDEV